MDAVLSLAHMIVVRSDLESKRTAGMYDMRDNDMLIIDGQIDLLDKLIDVMNGN